MRQTAVEPLAADRSQPVKVAPDFSAVSVLAVPPKLAAWPLVSVASSCS